MRQFRECIQFSIQFPVVLWSSNKITDVEYSLIDTAIDTALQINIEDTKKIPAGWEIFSSTTSAETEFLVF